ncbi:GfV-B53-ORF2 [Ichnoviriform fumiferanae]|uniref:GfV-B53-ORF2 n=1 Tax=Ichnoviriform fumiferanae TaxID=419435 RepID=A2PZV0_9VIRU|nr:GfV-B53-ORF2 [Ichnoviriform fumiferanae]BAF45522.1 GfV-B53-ORF2 [Ichnoviriform fumiferanae]
MASNHVIRTTDTGKFNYISKLSEDEKKRGFKKLWSSLKVKIFGNSEYEVMREEYGIDDDIRSESIKSELDLSLASLRALYFPKKTTNDSVVKETKISETNLISL